MIPTKSFRPGFLSGLCLILVTAGLMTSCKNGTGPILLQFAEARRLAADLRIQFNQAVDASNRAVMADTDESSLAFAREAQQAKLAAKGDTEALAPLLIGLQYTEESRLLEEFGRRFTEYQNLDRSILELAVENTNLKAQKLAFGPSREAADAFRKSLDAVTLATSPKNRCRVESLAAKAMLSMREIQVLHAPHIAESDDAAMSRMEKEMSDLEASARAALTPLSSLVEPAFRPQLAEALAALDRFKSIHTQIIALSRRNSNVRSLALALGQGRALTAACDANLSALQDTLAKEGFKATR